MVTTNAIGTIPDRFMGLSYEKIAMSYSYFHPSNRDLIALFRCLGNGVLRIGGGSVDHVLWMATGSGTHAQVTPANIEALAGFLRATGWMCLYGVNLATSTPALAAEEVAYAVATLGPSLLGIEIGNEPDGYGLAGQFFTGTGLSRISSLAGICFARLSSKLRPIHRSRAQSRQAGTISQDGPCPSVSQLHHLRLRS